MHTMLRKIEIPIDLHCKAKAKSVAKYYDNLWPKSEILISQENPKCMNFLQGGQRENIFVTLT